MKRLWAIGFGLLLCSCQSVKASEGHEKAPALETEACGAKGQPDCPTQRWMKATLQSYQRSHNYERLASALEELATKEPKGYDGWASIALRGAEAARQKDDPAVRESCRACHDGLRDRFKDELRHSVLF